MTPAGPATDPALPLPEGCRGAVLRDLHHRLAAAGFPCDPPETELGPGTRAAIRSFQHRRGITADGVCGPQTWAALVEAGFVLGDRLLYRRAPMVRGDDVETLQHRLDALGFDTGHVDGIFGPDTERALKDFQRNAGLTTDGVCGPDTLAALARLGNRTAGSASAAEVRERAQLLVRSSPTLEGQHLAIGSPGGLDALLETLARRLRDAGAVVALAHQADPSDRARAANQHSARAYLDLEVQDDDHVTLAYFATDNFTSVGGSLLADGLAQTLAVAGLATATPAGMRLPVLRETRMPAVRCALGPPGRVVRSLEEVAIALEQALVTWATEPAGHPPVTDNPQP